VIACRSSDSPCHSDRGERAATSEELQILVEHHARPGWSRIILDARNNPARGLVEGDGTLIAGRSDRLESGATHGARVFLEGLVQHLAHAPPPIVGMDADQMHVASLWRTGCDEAEQETNQNSVMLDDARHCAELIEEDRMREGCRWPAPPAIDDLNDVVVVLFTKWPGDHGSMVAENAIDREGLSKGITHSDRVSLGNAEASRASQWSVHRCSSRGQL
jgi:hypothetical protein